MRLVIETETEKLFFDLPKGSDKTVLETSLLKDMNGNNLPFIQFTDADGNNILINKNKIIYIKIDEVVSIFQ